MAVAGPISMVPALGLSSAAGLISMLEETEVQLQTTALRSLNKVIDTHWAEVAGSISVIEAMYEDEFFAQRELAALLASKVRHPPPTPSTRRAPPLAIFQGLPCAHTEPDLKRNLTRPSHPSTGLLPPRRAQRCAQLRTLRRWHVRRHRVQRFRQDPARYARVPRPQIQPTRCSPLDRLFPCEFWEEKSEQPI